MTHRPNASFPPVVRLAARLADARLIGAECVGLAQLFDPRGQAEDDDDFAYRTRAAAKVCARCSVRSPCATVAGELGGKAVGIWAGKVRSAPRPRGRPTTADAS
ncbi:WhiB family transcriptional regulator [Nocardia sp. CA-290969]|uniref:WhiB family transcriptional regulator n=1 Tax=Nocardia sp. CA-290969 TaxID=3239986 RepID=UPI003D8F3AEB